MCVLGHSDGNMESRWEGRKLGLVWVNNKDDLDQNNDHGLKERRKKQTMSLWGFHWDLSDGLNMGNERVGLSFLDYPTTLLLHDWHIL